MSDLLEAILKRCNERVIKVEKELAEALELLRECREALTFYDNDHSTDIIKKLESFLG